VEKDKTYRLYNLHMQIRGFIFENGIFIRRLDVLFLKTKSSHAD